MWDVGCGDVWVGMFNGYVGRVTLLAGAFAAAGLCGPRAGFRTFTLLAGGIRAERSVGGQARRADRAGTRRTSLRHRRYRGVRTEAIGLGPEMAECSRLGDGGLAHAGQGVTPPQRPRAAMPCASGTMGSGLGSAIHSYDQPGLGGGSSSPDRPQATPQASGASIWSMHTELLSVLVP
ncbi:hypothetical protein BDZ91DRAFT_824587 [Kalaharituber pfeilii]|nr:hypothetical protein BDZ91DRAFT_824587 [Kalaharituber pfeilii]